MHLQYVGGKVDKVLYGEFEVTYDAASTGVWLYVLNEEEGQLIVIDMDSGELVKGPIDVGPHPCKLWISESNYNFVGINNCDVDRFGQQITDPETGSAVESSFTIVDMNLAGSGDPYVLSRHPGVLMHDISFRQEEGLEVGYGVDRRGSIYAFNQTSGEFGPLLADGQPFNICADRLTGSSLEMCQAGEPRQFDYVAGENKIFNSIVQRPDNHLFVQVPGNANRHILMEVIPGSSAQAPIVDNYFYTAGQNDWYPGGFIVPRDLDLASHFQAGRPLIPLIC